MMKITAIHGGGDWHDASAEYLIVPENINIEQEKNKWEEWYRTEYCNHNIEFINFKQWLINLGARETTDDELEIIWEP